MSQTKEEKRKVLLQAASDVLLELGPHKTTLDDIARRAGCSENTVSLALRDSPRISATTRERIRAIAASGVRLDVVHATNWNFEGLGAVIGGRVPVVMMRHSAGSCMAARDLFVCMFLMAWASSRTTVCHETEASSSPSRGSRP